MHYPLENLIKTVGYDDISGDGDAGRGIALKTRVTVVKDIEKRIILLRGQRLMLDADLAALYGIDTKSLNGRRFCT